MNILSAESFRSFSKMFSTLNKNKYVLIEVADAWRAFNVIIDFSELPRATHTDINKHI